MTQVARHHSRHTFADDSAKVRVFAHLVQVRHAGRVVQQPLGGKDSCRFAEGAVDLAAQGMEVLAGRGGRDDTEVVFALRMRGQPR